MKKTDFKKLEDEPIWKESCDLAEHIYGLLPDFPEEEKWDSQRKLRSSANDLVLAISQSLGNANLYNTEYDWGSTRKYASGLKGMYRFAGRQKFIELEPEIMMRLDALIEQIDQRIVQGHKDLAQRTKEEIKPWLEKYRIWKEITK